MNLRGRLRRTLARLRTSRIGLRVLAFNLLVLFLPVAGILYLDVYEARLLETQERGMVAQARVAAAALGNRDVLVAGEVQAFLSRFGSDTETRVRVYDPTGVLLGDSRRATIQTPDAVEYGASESSRQDLRRRTLYRVGAWIAGVRSAGASRLRRAFGRDEASEQAPDPQSAIAPEVRIALAGRYGAATRPTPGQRSLTLSGALAVRHGDRITGAVVVSQSTFRILQALYSLRLRIFEVVVASIALAALLSALMSATIVRPLVRLRRAATSLAERRTPLAGTFRVVDRRDEIGDLARALDELATRLDAHIRLLESVAADVSHEFRNPLASIRTAAELLVSTDNPEDRARFYSMLTNDVDRLSRLVAGVQELARIDAQLAQEPATPVDVGAMLSDLSGAPARKGEPVTLRVSGRQLIRASPDRLVQVFENILQNARSFAPGQPIEVRVDREGAFCRVSVADRGPGIPEPHLERVFERFFSYRPAAQTGRRDHAGLGLAIARTIVEGYGGTISAANRDGGGACFEVRLPSADVVSASGLRSSVEHRPDVMGSSAVASPDALHSRKPEHT